MLLSERQVQIAPAPIRDRGERTPVTILRRHLSHKGLAFQRPPPDVGEAEKVERRARRLRMPAWRALDPEVHQPRLGRVEREPVPTKTLAQDGEEASRGQEVLEGRNQVVGVPDQQTVPLKAWFRLRREPSIQHVVQVDVREKRREHPTHNLAKFVCRLVQLAQGQRRTEQPGRRH